MIIYNETFVVGEASSLAWLNWMKMVYIPEVIATGLFHSYKILTVINSPNEGVTYCIQFLTDDLQKYHLFDINGSPALHGRLNQQFENKFVMFNSIMQLVEEK
jgi:hypothetical protein